ncbi:MAG: phosphatidylserine decarboxylase [Betaproteobacteria bacterium]|nr:phosphatidylserine decarboxylase [Betaproteobacteria bacterium]NBS45631.1 phosphatidylserine decarboxylase [Betaproteobacteria bacterium]
MKPSLLRRLALQDDLNFLLTNRIPRITATHFMGWFSKIESPWLARLSIAIWRLFTDLDLSDAKTRRYRSLHECFTRELVEGARTVDMGESVISSPCDAIVAACGRVHEGQIYQAKGLSYSLRELVGPDTDVTPFEEGAFVTLRLTSAMYHRFHAPHDISVHALNYISGDTWNVNPVTVRRIERLYCRNERAVIGARLEQWNAPILIVPVAAVLVASMRFHFADVLMHLRYRGPHRIRCDAALRKGQEMGWFEHGSTIIVFVPAGFVPDAAVVEGARLRMGQALLHRSDV